jgi:hypothetical protein
MRSAAKYSPWAGSLRWRTQARLRKSAWAVCRCRDCGTKLRSGIRVISCNSWTKFSWLGAVHPKVLCYLPMILAIALRTCCLRSKLRNWR